MVNKASLAIYIYIYKIFVYLPLFCHNSSLKDYYIHSEIAWCFLTSPCYSIIHNCWRDFLVPCRLDYIILTFKYLKIFLLVVWEFCIVDFDHICLLSASLIYLHFCIYPTACPFSVKSIKTSLCCPNSLGFVAFHWSIVGLKKTDSFPNIWLRSYSNNILFPLGKKTIPLFDKLDLATIYPSLLMFHLLSSLFIHVLIRCIHFFSTQGPSYVSTSPGGSLSVCLHVISFVSLSATLYLQSTHSLSLVEISSPFTSSCGLCSSL